MPYLSIIIPVYNRENLIDRAVASVLAQSFDDYEIIVVDDGSSDATRAVVEEIEDSRVRYVFQNNTGAAAARNRGARLANSDYLTFLDSDDEALPGWLERLHEAFVVDNADIVCCGLEKVGVGREVDEKGGVRLPVNMGPMYGDIVGRFTNSGSYALRRSIFEEVGGFDEELSSGQHTELAMRLVPMAQQRNWRIISVMEALIQVHVHGGDRIRGNPAAIYAGSTRTLSKHSSLFQRDPRKHSNYHGIAGVNAARLGMSSRARYHFLRAVKINPRNVRAWIRLIGAFIPAVRNQLWNQRSDSE